MSKKKKKDIPKSVIREKALKIFVRKKIVEISVVLALIFVPYFVGGIILGQESALCGEGKLFDKYSGEWSPQPDSCAHDYLMKWITGLFWLFILMAVIFLILMWIKYNWEAGKKELDDAFEYSFGEKNE